jgi:orotidine-5'-phosphate decarboxylase
MDSTFFLAVARQEKKYLWEPRIGICFEDEVSKDYLIFRWMSRHRRLSVATMLAGVVGMFKVGLELFIRSGPDIIAFIHSTGPAGVFLDLKLHDIPATVSRAMAGAAALGVRLATVHCGETQRMLEAAVAGSGGRVGVLGVTVLTSVSAQDIAAAGFREELAGDLPRLVLRRARMAQQAGCAGVVCSGLEAGRSRRVRGRFVTVTPDPAAVGGQRDGRPAACEYAGRGGGAARLSRDRPADPGCPGPACCGTAHR